MTDIDTSTTAVLSKDDVVTIEPVAVVDTAAAVELIDEALVRLLQRELVSANEVTDVLLDLRRVLVG